MPKIITYKEIKSFVESESNCKLLSECYEGVYAKMKFVCECGDDFETTFAQFKHDNKRQCNHCGRKGSNRFAYDDVKRFIEVISESDCILISKQYKGIEFKIDIQCKCGCLFSTTFATFKHGGKRQCNNCSGVTIVNYDSVKYFIQSNSECRLLSETYVNYSEKLRLQCKCGNEFETSFGNFKSNNKRECNNCSLEKGALKRAKTHEQFIVDLKGVTNEEYSVIGVYKNCKTKIKIKHNSCGHIWNAIPSVVLSGSGCPQCNRPNYYMDTAHFKSQVYNLVEDEYSVLGEYVRSNKNIKMKHNSCGHTFNMFPANFLYSQRCPQCAGNMKKSHEQFKQEVYAIVGEEYVVCGEYKNTKTHIKMRHNICETIYDVTPGNFLRGRRCPQCSESRGEENTRIYLQNNHPFFVPAYTFDGLTGVGGGLLRFDFSVFDSSEKLICLIE